jgi:hypothetical protein
MTKKSKIESGTLAVLVLIAGAVWYYHRYPGGMSARAGALAIIDYKPMGVENSKIHWERLTEAQQTEYKNSERDIFSVVLPPIPAPAPFHAPQPGDKDYTPPPPPPPPPAPPPPKLPLKYFGYGTVPEGEERRAFLTDGDAVYVVAEGDTVLGRYRVVKIGRVSLEFEEIGTKRRGTATLEDQGPGL